MRTTEEAEQKLGRCAGRLAGKLRRTARRWPVLPEGKRVALAVSGGLDSLAMAFLVGEHNRRLRRPLELLALHVRLDSDGTTTGLPDRIGGWLSSREIDLFEVDARFDASETLPLDCFACARARRRTLLETAAAKGATHVALGHHADDVVETWLLSLMYTGTAEVMPPIRTYFGGAVTIVRPLYELRSGELARVSRLAALPEPVVACRREKDARRKRIRTTLSALGRDQGLVRRQLYWAAVRQFEEQSENDG